MRSYIDWNKGMQAEQLFCKVTGATKGTFTEDVQGHIDVWLDGESYDVKSCKRSMQKGFPLVELRNVQGRRGWCEGGADNIAFFDGAKFMIVSRRKLLGFVLKMLDGDIDKPLRESGIHKRLGYDAIVYKPIGRKGRSDVFVYIRKADILSLTNKVYVV